AGQEIELAVAAAVPGRIVDALDQELVEALRRAVRDLFQFGGDLGDRPGFLRGDQADFGGHAVPLSQVFRRTLGVERRRAMGGPPPRSGLHSLPLARLPYAPDGAAPTTLADRTLRAARA